MSDRCVSSRFFPGYRRVFEPHTVHMPQLHSTCFQSRLDIDNDDSHPSCVAQPTCRCQEQSCAQDTVQIHGNHGSGALLIPFPFLVCGALATERVCCLSLWSSRPRVANL